MVLKEDAYDEGDVDEGDVDVEEEEPLVIGGTIGVVAAPVLAALAPASPAPAPAAPASTAPASAALAPAVPGDDATMEELRAYIAAMQKQKAAESEQVEEEEEDPDLPWWAEHADFPDEWRLLPPCEINPKINQQINDGEAEERVRLSTALLWKDLENNGWYFPKEKAGAYCNMPSEVFIKILRFARSPEIMLPWNAMDLDKKVTPPPPVLFLLSNFGVTNPPFFYSSGRA
jgi:hypothetical protein